MYYGGIDAHKTYLTLAVVDKNGEVVHRRKRVPIGDGEALLEEVQDFRPLKVVVETCPFWPWIHDLVAETDIEFQLAHASRLEAIARARKKTDSVDAELLARMLQGQLIPEAYPKPRSQRETARLIRLRATMVRDRTRSINRIHNQLHHKGIQSERETLLRDKGRRWLEQTVRPRLAPRQQATVDTQLELVDFFTAKIEVLDEEIEQEARNHPAAILLQTIPGIGPYRSLLLATEVLPIKRFDAPGRLVSYAGLAPTVKQSGTGHPRHGAVPRGANRWVRGALVSSIPSHLQGAPDSAVSVYYQELKERLGWPTARVAAARKLCRAIYAMLKSGEVWRD